MSREAFMVVGADGQPGRLVNPAIAPICWTAGEAGRLVVNLDRLARVGVPGAPHRVIRVRIERVKK